MLGAIGDMTHAPLFGGLMWGLLIWMQSARPHAVGSLNFWGRSGLAGLALFAISLLVEVIQKSFGRSASVQDAMSNGLGILAAIALFVAWRIHRERQTSPSQYPSNSMKTPLPSVALVSGAMVCLAICWWDPVQKLNDVVNVHRRFPMLSSFETPYELQRWYFRGVQRSLTDQNVREGNHCLEMVVRGPSDKLRRSLCGCTLFEMHGDWSDMNRLRMDVRFVSSSDAPILDFLIKVVDQDHTSSDDDCFRELVTVSAGDWHTLSFSREAILAGPAGRKMDLTRIRYLDVFPESPHGQTKIWIDNVRLE